MGRYKNNNNKKNLLPRKVETISASVPNQKRTKALKAKQSGAGSSSKDEEGIDSRTRKELEGLIAELDKDGALTSAKIKGSQKGAALTPRRPSVKLPSTPKAAVTAAAAAVAGTSSSSSGRNEALQCSKVSSSTSSGHDRSKFQVENAAVRRRQGDIKARKRKAPAGDKGPEREAKVSKPSELSSSSSSGTRGKVGRHRPRISVRQLKYGERWADLWGDDGQDEEAVGAGKNSTGSGNGAAELEEAELMLAEEAERFSSSSSSANSEKEYLFSVLKKSGTLSDKISAYTVLLQENPVQNLAALEALINMVSLKSRRPCMMALDALKPLFIDHLLVPGRKLRFFSQHPEVLPVGALQDPGHRRRALVLMAFEHKLKQAYAKFLDRLEEVSRDTVEKSRVQAMSMVLDLLVANPEQEQALLSKLVNKLGDPVRSVASKAAYQLSKLLEAHPAMKGVVAGEVERLLFRPNVSARAQYYGICCLSQVVFAASSRKGHPSATSILEQAEGPARKDDDEKLANKLIGIYLTFFKKLVEKGQVDSKLVAAILTGVNRAVPYSNLKSAGEGPMQEHLETMYRVVHMTNFGISLQALILLHRIAATEDGAECDNGRFFTAFYKKLLDPDLAVSNSKQAMFLNLTFKSMKGDPEVPRVLAFIRRLLQVASHMQPHLVCSVLYLVSEVLKVRPDVFSAFDKLKSSSDGWVKTTVIADDDDDDEEVYRDVKSDDDDDGGGDKGVKHGGTGGSSWVFRELTSSSTSSGTAGTRSPSKHSAAYDPWHRNPLYANATGNGGSCLWELEQLADNHYHPSVRLFAGSLLASSAASKEPPVQYKGDPMKDFTLARFLDRFVFRNPKKDPTKGKPRTVFGKRALLAAAPASSAASGQQGTQGLAVDSKDYVRRDETQIPLEERFIHKYFRERQKALLVGAADDKDDDDDDAASVNSDEFEMAINQDLRKGRGNQVGGDEAVDLEGFEDDAVDGDDEDADGLEDDDLEAGDNESGEDEFGDDESGDDEFDDEDEVELTKGGKKAIKGRRPKGGDHDLSQLLASADDFASLIEENASEGDSLGTLDAVFNKDRSSAKQLQWESERYSGGDRRASRAKSGAFSRKNNKRAFDRKGHKGPRKGPRK